MVKPIIETEMKVSGITHRKKTKGGEHEYKYGAVVINSQALAEYIGKTVKVKIEKFKKG